RPRRVSAGLLGAQGALHALHGCNTRTSGLDVKESNAFGQLLVQLVAERGIGILMIEHDMSLVLNICDPIHVLDFGKPLMVGSPAEVRASEIVRDAYLGKAAVA